MGLQITTDEKGVKVIRQDKTSQNGTPYTRYSLMVSSKDGDEWVNGFIDCAFPKGTDIPNKSIIQIKNAFYLTSKYQDKVYTKIFIKDFEIVQGDASAQTQNDGWMNVPEGEQAELPYAIPTR